MKSRTEIIKNDTTNTLSKRKKAELLSVNLSSSYTVKKESSEMKKAMINELQETYEKRPFYGYRRMTYVLKDKGFAVNHKAVYGMMKSLNMQAIYPKKNLSKRRQEDAVYPYLLKKHPPEKPHDTWCVDITYVKMPTGYVYLTALIDVVSRYVLGHHVSTSLDTHSCLKALEDALSKGFKPKIINCDQGCQFTSHEWTMQVHLLGAKLSMDGKGRCLDNIPIERFWRSFKYEEAYLRTYETVAEARLLIADYIDFYNHERRHSGLCYARPYEVMMGQKVAMFWPFMRVKKEEKIEGILGCEDAIKATKTKQKYMRKETRKSYDSLDVFEDLKIILLENKKEKQETKLSFKNAA